MAEPPAKRARRTDNPAIMDQNKSAPRTEVPRQPSSRKDASKSDNKDRRHRSRSRSRTERRRDRSADTKPHSRASPSAKERRDGRDRNRRPRERSHSRDRQKSRRDDRQRSRSPHRESSRRSPPKGPRALRNRSRERHPGPPNNGGDRAKSNAGGGTSSRAAPERAEKAVGSNEEAKSAMEMEIDGAGREGAADDDVEAQMKAVMGFGGFKSTKNTKVPGNDKLFGVRKEKRTEYRQYMNRVGGFNRPLSPSHE